jgi:hypothetical protein
MKEEDSTPPITTILVVGDSDSSAINQLKCRLAEIPFGSYDIKALPKDAVSDKLNTDVHYVQGRRNGTDVILMHSPPANYKEMYAMLCELTARKLSAFSNTCKTNRSKKTKKRRNVTKRKHR